MLIFIFRRLLLITLLAGPQWFWISQAARLAGHIKLRAIRRLAYSLLFIAELLMALVVFDRVTGRVLPAPFGGVFSSLVQLWIISSTFACLCVLTLRLVAWLLMSLRSIFHPVAQTLDNTRRRFMLRQTLTFIGSAPIFAALYGYAFERLSFEVVRVDLPIANLPEALDGLRIVQLSDIHVGDSLPPSEVRRAVSMANRLGAHLAVITGDILSGRGDPLAACIAELALLKAPLGVWGCNGNHEIYAGAEDETEQLFELHGMRMLRQSAAQIAWNGGTFNLIGVDYQHDVQLTGSRLPSLRLIQPLVRRDIPNILLSHNPNTFYSAAELGIELSLSGHTHGGQVNIEINHSSLNPARFMTRFIAGPYQLPMAAHTQGNPAKAVSWSQLYVNRGLGTLALPARIGAAPEITLLTLRRG
jgi:predicted MPP superfamily phosphohydrolase